MRDRGPGAIAEPALVAIPARAHRTSSSVVPGVPDHPAATRPRRRRLSLAMQFLLANCIVLLTGMLVTGVWVGQQIEHGVLNRTGAIAALYVESFVEPHLAQLATRPSLDEASVAALDRLLSESPLGERVVAFKIWSPQGVVLYSRDRELIGRRFPVQGELARATRGDVAAELTNLDEEENELERGRWDQLLEVYAPVRERGGSRVIAVAEFYQRTDELDEEIATARWRSWAVVAGVTLVAYLLLAGIVRRGSDTIARQQAALRAQVAELSLLLEQNARLHERVRQAAGRTTALNEQALRRISADLHDSPAQTLALALLRLEALCEQVGDADSSQGRDFATVHGAVRDALAEVRAISAGLRLPELAPLSVAEVAERAVRDHERRSGTSVALTVEVDPPAGAPLPVKIALLRTLQEGLSNATRHGGGAGVCARVWIENGALCLEVSDEGPGFVPERVGTEATAHLGLAGMRERAELLGGSFRVESAPGRGTTVRVCWPLAEQGDGWATQFA